VISIRSLQ